MLQANDVGCSTDAGQADDTHLQTSVECPHLILDSVLLEDVHRLEKSEALYFPWWLVYFNRNAKFFSSEHGKVLIAV